MQLAGEVAEISDLLSVASKDLQADAALAEEYGVTDAPTMVLVAVEDDQRRDYGVRYMGAPGGHEFTSFIHGVVDVSRGETQLKAETREFLATLKEPLHLQVFVTPT